MLLQMSDCTVKGAEGVEEGEGGEIGVYTGHDSQQDNSLTPIHNPTLLH